MDAPLNQIFSPSSFQELFSTWNHFPDAVLYAGGTGFIREQSRRVPVLPRNLISLDKMDELRRTSRTERYLEIGAMVKLNQIINLGKVVPEVLTCCLQQIASPQIRNQATIGGNICFPSRRLDTSAPLIALDTQYELRTAQSTRWISASRFSSQPEGGPGLKRPRQDSPGPHGFAGQEILTRIRVPMESWTFTSYRKLHVAGSTESGGGILFIMNNQKDILTNIRIIYSGNTILREKNSENMLLGKHLPLDRKNAEAFVDCWRTYLTHGAGNSQPELIKVQIMNFIKIMVQHISD